ncbi:MAG: diaminopimelate epimerase [Muribaculaceae bacterium]|nr:diaminopimelate epimerase [Muribaculaceae bacterium]
MKSKREVPFVKMHGIGNDYVYMDCLRGETPSWLTEENLPSLTRKISDRHFGVGSDGLILILPSEKSDFRMRIFNSDGSEAKMCGNGIRCVGKYLYDRGFTKKTSLEIETNSGIRHLKLIRGADNQIESVEVDMGSPYFKRGEIPAAGSKDEEMADELLYSAGKTFSTTGVGMGNPHGVIFVEDVESLDLQTIGPSLERHEIWPDRANIEFVKIVGPKEIRVRVWERGSGETLACGTGACAAAVASYRKGFTEDEIKVTLRGGDLKISYDKNSNRVKMTGPAEFVCEGKFYL